MLWQSISFFLLTEGVLIGASTTRPLHETPRLLLGLIGLASTLLFASTYGRSRYMADIHGIWLHQAGNLDPGGMMQPVIEAADKYYAQAKGLSKYARATRRLGTTRDYKDLDVFRDRPRVARIHHLGTAGQLAKGGRAIGARRGPAYADRMATTPGKLSHICCVCCALYPDGRRCPNRCDPADAMRNDLRKDRARTDEPPNRASR